MRNEGRAPSLWDHTYQGFAAARVGSAPAAPQRARVTNAGRLAAPIAILASAVLAIGVGLSRPAHEAARPIHPAAPAAQPGPLLPAPAPPEPASLAEELPPPPPLPAASASDAGWGHARARSRREGQRRLAAAAVRPAFHCEWRLRPSERMVCHDAELARLDRRLNHAFYLAVRRGAPRASLRAQQDRWEDLRERAARGGSQTAVAELYRRRIAQLDAMGGRG